MRTATEQATALAEELQTIDSEVLARALRDESLVEAAKTEMANRGLGVFATWIGFDEAKKAWFTR